MSPANVYRYFSSKRAINDAVADRLFAEVIALAIEASVTPRTPAERLRATLAAIEKRHADRFLNEKHLHELVVISVREDWLVSRSFAERIESIVADIISEGIARHQFQGGDGINPWTMSSCNYGCVLRSAPNRYDGRFSSTEFRADHGLRNWSTSWRQHCSLHGRSAPCLQRAGLRRVDIACAIVTPLRCL